MIERLQTQLENASAQLIRFGYGLAEAVLVMAIAWALHRTLRRPVRRWLSGASIRANAKVLIENGITIVVYLFAFSFLLELWGVTWAALLAAISVSTIIVGLGLQDLLKSFAAGLFILFEQPFTLGDEIEVRGISGRVVGIGLRKTTLQVESGDLVTAPNSILFTDLIRNQSAFQTMRTTITVSEIEDASENVKDQVLSVLQNVPGLKSNPQITVRWNTDGRKPRRQAHGLEDLEERARMLVESYIPHRTQVQISWIGSGAPTVQDEVVRRLRLLFPQATIRVFRE